MFHAFCFALTLLLLVSPGVAFAANSVYTAVVDAGSGGTRLLLYRVVKGPYPDIKLLYQGRVENPDDLPFPRDEGIDNYACNTGADPAAKAFYARRNVNPHVMTPLWDGLKAELAGLSPPVQPADVVVKVYATAGMRSALEICGAKAVRRLYKTIHDGMAVSGFTNVINEVRTIDGAREEGLWSFINANDEYTNAFGRPGHAKLPQAPVGIFEVGGSSVQVAYPLPLATADPKAIRININNKKLAVHAVSYLHLGQTDMRWALRGATNANNQPIAFKCWANGFDKTHDKGDEGYPRLTQNGAFNTADPACRNFMRRYIRTYMPKPLDLSQTNASFVGLGGFKYTLEAFGPLVNPYSGTNDFTASVNARCMEDAATWTDIETDSRIQYYCPHGAYIAALITDPKLGIFRQRPAKFDRALTATDVNNQTLSWIQGYLLLTYAQ